MDVTEEPTMHNLVNKSMILEKYGEKIGIIGVILKTTNEIAKTGKLKFSDEAEAVRAEADKLNAQGVNKIIVISHCGLNIDRRIALDGGPHIDLIVGGHSHTLLFNGSAPLDRPADNYPVIVDQTGGHRVLIVQASAYTKYVGDIVLHFDANGIVQSWEGNPVFLANYVPKDPTIEAALQPWKTFIDAEGTKVAGSISFNVLDDNCYNAECLMGSLQADSMAYSAFDYEKSDDSWTWATIGITNPGGVRSSLSSGNLTYYDLVATTPFENTCDKLEVQGKYLREMFEYSVSGNSRFVLQTSGVRVVFNMTQPANKRVHEFKVLCRQCDIPRYEDVDDETWYRVVLTNFMLLNGDNYAMIRDNMREHQKGVVDIDALKNYVEKHSPITMLQARQRVKFVN
jgi:5'-nucleotidase